MNVLSNQIDNESSEIVSVNEESEDVNKPQYDSSDNNARFLKELRASYDSSPLVAASATTRQQNAILQE